jgi:hypothetical protein
VTTSTDTTYLDSRTGQEGPLSVDVTFSSVDSSGETIVSGTSNEAGLVNSTFAVEIGACSISGQPCGNWTDCPPGESCSGFHGQFFDVSTTAAFSGPVTVCTDYLDEEPTPVGGDGIVDGTDVPEANLRLFHRGGGTSFDDVTSALDPIANRLCGEASSLSPFVVAAFLTCNDPTDAQGFLSNSKVLLRRIASDTTPGNDVLVVRADFDLPQGTTFAGLDPLEEGLRLVLSNSQGEPRVDVSLPGGAFSGAGTAGWTLVGNGRSWIYRDRTGAPVNGIVKVAIKDRSNQNPGRVRVIVRGRLGDYPITAGDSPLQAAVILGGRSASLTGRCGRRSFAPLQCSFNAAGNGIACRH